MPKINFQFLTVRKKGFSIGEVILSAFVLAVGIVAVIGLISNSIRHSIDSRDEIIASHLAQEGVELARNIRDNNWANNQAYDFGIATNNNTCIDYSVDTAGDPILSFPCASYKLYYNNTSGRYTHSSLGTSLTKFSRKIIISDTTAPVPPGKVIESKVWWGSTDPASCTVGNKCVSAISILTDHPH